MKKNNKKGFTLVELVIVVAVMAVLVAVAIPTISSITGEAKDAVAESNAKTIESIIKLEEAELSKNSGTLNAKAISKAIYEAKLGIKKDATATTAPTFFYNPKTGAVVATKLPTGATTTDYTQIVFDTDGNALVNAVPGVTDDPAGTYKGLDASNAEIWVPKT